MRLIDADKLKHHFYVLRYVHSYDIDNAPTVKAIPKEWIRDYMRRLPNGSEAYECILVMLENWEKENEKG